MGVQSGTELLEALLRELHLFEHWCEHHDVKPLRPNSMNNYGFMMSQLGLDFALDEFLDEWLVPITSRLFHEHAGDALDHHHSFVVDYAESGDTALGFHVDDSEVTVNACLGFAFEGAEVYFEGERCLSHRQEAANDAESWTWSPSPGMALLHAGTHRHGVRPLRAGRRLNLIVWARSTRHRRGKPTPHQGPVTWCPGCEAA